ncbi:motile sperm domain-containing protein 1-like [Notolabrus celidotus]|uniref:motile sperm domain-containing protein 1-like n=1 Tax=Notolabrus celidotus TaxID=1203425 RepID=UPI00148F6490|nr:motile sperm domain-containing protein 1-like [Notolabrus celidotus]XP_034532540.1 motile sperm domain-containing protein 1-like [Notolabrus celidotus]
MRRKNSHDGQGQGGTGDQGTRRGDRGQAGVRQAERGETGGETGGGSSLPVFLFPSELLFHPAETASHRRVLTLYNPYNFSLSFKMLCTAPSLYRVVESEGSVRAKSCVDLVVRHLDVSPRHWGRRDCFRLEVRGGGQMGGREVWAELRGGEEGGGGGGEAEEERRRRKRGGEERRVGGQQRASSPQTPLSPLLVPTNSHLPLPTCPAVRSVSQWVVCVSVAVLCVTVLMLPLHTESSSVVPRCLHVSTNQKLVCAYTLGLLTMVFLR